MGGLRCDVDSAVGEPYARLFVSFRFGGFGGHGLAWICGGVFLLGDWIGLRFFLCFFLDD